MINQEKHLAYTLKVNIKEIHSIIENIDNYYKERNIIKEGKNGKHKFRIINPSQRRLKVIQKRIQDRILLKLELPSYGYGAVKGRDNVDNANTHKGKKYKFTTDLRNFFPSISHHKVFEMFLLYSFSPEVSRILTQLTTYKGRLPQGAPTSSTIANLVFVKTGNNLNSFAKEHQLTFTSFVDDLTFSSPVDFKDVTNEIIDMIIKDGFKISHNKTNYSRNPIVTGIHPMNNSLKLPQTFLDKLKDSANKTEEQIRGLVQYKKKVEKRNQKSSIP